MRQLGLKTWSMLFAYAVSLFGSGMTEPYLVLYLHHHNGIDMVLAGTIIAMISVSGVAAIPISGWIGERVGAENSLMVMLLIAGCGEVMMAVIHHPPGAFVAVIFLGSGHAGSWNAFSSLLAGGINQTDRNHIFGAAFSMQNFAMGAGAAAGGWLLASIGFRSLFFMDAATFFLFATFIKIMLFNSERMKVRASRGTENHWVFLKDTSLMAIVGFYALFAVLISALSMIVFPQWAAGGNENFASG